jgi:uncharacterized protein
MKCLDTYMLIYAADTASPFHRRAVELVEQSIAGQWPACVCEQSLHEFAAIMTSDRAVKRPLSPEAAWKMIDKLLRYPQPDVLYSDETIVRRALHLMEKYSARRVNYAAAHKAATMLAHGVRILVTADSDTYAAIRELEIENPFETLFA